MITHLGGSLQKIRVVKGAVKGIKEGAGENGKSIKPSKVEECGGVSKLEAVDVLAGGPSVRWVRTNLPGATSTNFGGPLLRVL